MSSRRNQFSSICPVSVLMREVYHAGVVASRCSVYAPGQRRALRSSGSPAIVRHAVALSAYSTPKYNAASVGSPDICFITTSTRGIQRCVHTRRRMRIAQRSQPGGAQPRYARCVSTEITKFVTRTMPSWVERAVETVLCICGGRCLCRVGALALGQSVCVHAALQPPARRQPDIVAKRSASVAQQEVYRARVAPAGGAAG